MRTVTRIGDHAKAARRIIHYIEGVLEEGACFDRNDVERILREELPVARPAKLRTAS